MDIEKNYQLFKGIRMRKNNKKKLLLALTLLLIVSLACGVSSNEGNLETAAAETVEVELTTRAQVAQAETQATADSPLMTATFTSIPTGTPIPAATATPTSEIDCDVAAFVSDVTVPDGSDFIPGENFTKTWRLKNVGSCPWTAAYDLVFFDGEQMGGPVSQPLINSGEVEPNDTVDVSVDLTAPGAGGNYTGYWKIRNNSNVVFELSNGDPFYVEIDVIEPTATSEFPLLLLTPFVIIGPDFNANYGGNYNCFLNNRAMFQIENTGFLTIESIEIFVEGPLGILQHHSIQNAPFKSSSKLFPECWAPGFSSLVADDIRFIHVGLGSLPLPGIPGEATIKVCGLDDLGGFCKEKTINFIW